MANKLTCDIITTERPLFSGACDSLVAPAYDGLVGIRPDHAPFITELGIGVAEIATTENNDHAVKRFAVRDGFLQVVNNKVTLLAASAVAVTDLPAPEKLAAEGAKLEAEGAKASGAQAREKLAADRKWLKVRQSLRS